MNYLDGATWADTAPDDPAGQIIHLVRRIAFAYSDRVALAAAQLGLHPTDLRALALILDATRAGDVLTAGSLGAQLPINQPSVTAVVDRLVNRELVERIPVPGDRRKVGLVVTTMGRTTGWTAFGSLIEDLHKNLSAASSRQLTDTEHILQRTLDVLTRTTG